MKIRLSRLSAWLLVCSIPSLPAGEAPPSPEPPPSASSPAAQEAPSAPPAVLPEVIVTATRSGEDPATVPFVTQSIDGGWIRETKAARTLPRALSEVPAISVQQTANGQESPYIRGFTGFRTLLLVDGIRVNNAVFRDGPNQYWGLVDPLSIERMEVVKGPSSVLYGSDAIGGTVNALTLEDFPEGIHPGGYYRYSSAEDSNTVRGEARGLYREKLGWTGGVAWRDYGDLSGGRDTGVQEYTDYEALSADAKTTWRISKIFTLTAAFQSRDEDDVPRTHSTIYGTSFHGTQVGTDLRRESDLQRRMAYLRAEAKPDAAWLQSASLTLSYQLIGEDDRRVLSKGNSQIQGFDDHTGGVQMALVSPSPIGTWTYGAEYYGDFVDSFRKDYTASGALQAVRPRGPVADDARYDAVGAFIQDEIHPVERLTVIAGGRYNYAHAAAKAENIDPNPSDALAYEDLSESFEALVGSGRALYRLTDHLSPFAGVSQGFRAPNLSDLTRFDAARSGEQEIPATGLDPEHFISYEGGLRGRWDRWGGSVSYFYTDIRDMIVRTPTGDLASNGDIIVHKDNAGDGYLHGVELALDWNFHKGWTAFGTFSWMDGAVETFVDGTTKRMEPISRIPQTQFLLGLRWDSEDRRYWAETTLRIALEQDHLSPEDKLDTQRIPPGGTPGYHLVGLRGGVRLREKLSLFAGVENITDEDYRVHGSGVNGPGTNFIGGLELRL